MPPLPYERRSRASLNDRPRINDPTLRFPAIRTFHVLLLSGHSSGRSAQHMSFCLGSIFALKYFTQWRLSVSKQAQLQFSPSHQRTTCGLVGHQPILGGGPLLYFISSLSRESNTITSLGGRGQRTLCRGRHLGAQQVGYGKPAASRILWNVFGS